MTDSSNFEQRIRRSIQESIAVKNLLLGSADIISTDRRGECGFG